MQVAKRFKFDAAHRLPNYVGACSRLHGHTWFLEVKVDGPVGRDGFVVDFAVLKKYVETGVISLLDHQCLNELKLPFSSNPTCENVLVWLWSQLDTHENQNWRLFELRLYESPDSYAQMGG